MKDYFIYSYIDYQNFKDGSKTITVLFIAESKIRKNSLIQGLEKFNQENILSDKFVVIIPEYCDEQLVSMFERHLLDTFRRVVGFNQSYVDENFSVYQFDSLGEPKKKLGQLKGLIGPKKFFKDLFQNGNFYIFSSREGLMESTPDHHFVFPSGKHSEKFIRTANVLRDSNEIFFIAIQLLSKFMDVETIYCDTASINVLPFAVFEIQGRFGIKNEIRVKSFDSYKVFEDFNQLFQPESLVLISSSTSGNIIDRLRKKQVTDDSEIMVLFFLGDHASYLKHKKNIFCNISFSKKFQKGFNPFKTFKNGLECELCSNHSQPVLIQTDIFLNVEPKYNTLTLKKSDTPKFLSRFVEEHKAEDETSNIFKVHYRDIEEDDKTYEIYLDYTKLLQNGEHPTYPRHYYNKLIKKINSHVPANTKYILPLRDPSSKALAEFIIKNNAWVKEPITVNIDNPEKIDNQVMGTLVVVGATYVTGRHYFYINRLLRRYPKLSIVYFIGIARSMSKTFSENIKSNLGIGEYGGGTFPVVSVEEIYIPQAKNKNSWSTEYKFIRKLLGELDDSSTLFKYLYKRYKVLLESRENKGLTNNVFLRKLDGECLKLRKGFVYWNFEVVPEIAFQSQVYFTISAVVNKLRNEPINSNRSLRQSTYVRNLISAETFNRFNDGIIQASLLRAADYRMLSYDLDEAQSFAITVFLKSLVDKFDEDHGEALPEFLLAIALKKLRFKRLDLRNFIDHSKSVMNKGDLIYDFVLFLEKDLL